jgi:hypothetical protein
LPASNFLFSQPISGAPLKNQLQARTEKLLGGPWLRRLALVVYPLFYFLAVSIFFVAQTIDEC